MTHLAHGHGSLGIGHWLIVLAIVALIFGTFKDAMREGAERKDS